MAMTVEDGNGIRAKSGKMPPQPLPQPWRQDM